MKQTLVGLFLLTQQLRSLLDEVLGHHDLSLLLGSLECMLTAPRARALPAPGHRGSMCNLQCGPKIVCRPVLTTLTPGTGWASLRTHVLPDFCLPGAVSPWLDICSGSCSPSTAARRESPTFLSSHISTRRLPTRFTLRDEQRFHHPEPAMRQHHHRVQPCPSTSHTVALAVIGLLLRSCCCAAPATQGLGVSPCLTSSVSCPRRSRPPRLRPLLRRTC